MALFKFQNHNAIKNAQNNPRAIATEVIKNGFAFKIENNYEDLVSGKTLKEAAVPFATAAEAKAGDVWVAFNIVDKPEVLNYVDYAINAGEPVRAFNLAKMKGEVIEVSGDVAIDDYTTIVVGDILVPCDKTTDTATPMNWKVDNVGTGYKTALEVLAKTPFGGFTVDGTSRAGGLEVKVVEVAGI